MTYIEFNLDKLKRKAPSKPSWYFDEIMASAKHLEGDRYEISVDDRNRIKKKLTIENAKQLTEEARAERARAAEVRRQEQVEREAAALPSAWERVRKGSVGLAKVALGVDRSTDDLIAARKAICEACPHLKGSTCELCKCLYRQKIKLSTEECPIGKW